MRVRVLVYNRGVTGFGASSPREIKDALRPYYPSIKRLLLGHPEMTFLPKPEDVVINWGCIKAPDFWPTTTRWLNAPASCARSGHRINALTIMKEAGVNVPDFTTNHSTAQQWLSEGRSIVRRNSLRSFGGQGITVVNPGGILAPGAPLYTRYRPKKHEYRVHVFRGSVIDVQQKKRRNGFKEEHPDVDTKIRSYANGWVFTRDGVSAPGPVLAQALQAVSALGLDFAAVDVGWSPNKEIATVYECNTAPGLEGTTITKYADAIRTYLQSV